MGSISDFETALGHEHHAAHGYSGRSSGWEPDQIQFGLHLRRQGKLLGDRSQKRFPEPKPA